MMLETYYRKRSRRAHQVTTDMDQSSQKVAEPGSITGAKSPVLGRHHVTPPLSSEKQRPKFQIQEPAEDGDKSQLKNHIEVGNLYEIDHNHLPPRSPVQLRRIRVAMVSEKTELSIAVRFPSMESLRAFFSNRTLETQPVMDENFVMGMGQAANLLIRLVPREIFYQQKSREAFWLISWFEDNANVGHEKGVCLSELINCKGMVRWGIKRQVKYITRQKESDNIIDANPQNSSSSFVNATEDGQMKSGGPFEVRESEKEEEKEAGDEDGIEVENKVKREDGMHVNEGEAEEEIGDDQEDDNEEVEDEVEEEKIQESNENTKRKRYSIRNTDQVRKTKKEKLEKKKTTQKQKKNQAKKNASVRFKGALVLRNPKDRWSAERYKLAEQSLLEVMKAKGATADKPILRPRLRTEARKRIGDTGLLDHLLKHMAGRLAPGGGERFRRRHNADGAMEYWLESADLVNIRKNAGVNDPYWVPPPGWNPGDSPTQDPTCARELKLLKDEVSKIKRDVELMVTKMQLKEELGKLRRELDELTSTTKEQQTIIAASRPNCISETLGQLAVSWDSKSDIDKALAPLVEKYKEQLMIISDFVREVEEKSAMLTSNMGGRTRADSALMVPTESAADKEKKKMATEPKRQQQQVQALMAAEAEKSELNKDQSRGHVIPTPKAEETEKRTAGSPAAEEKAAKIQRPKSGFRICKPHGTFLWPNMVKNNANSSSSMISPRVVVQVEVPTPPSVSSSSASALSQQLNYHRHPAPPIKPLAEKRAVAVTVFSVSPGSNYEAGAKNYSPKTPLINSNKTLVNPNAMALMQLPLAVNTTPGEGVCAGSGPGTVMVCGERLHNTCCSSSTASSLPSPVGDWLALSTRKSASEECGHG